MCYRIPAAEGAGAELPAGAQLPAGDGSHHGEGFSPLADWRRQDLVGRGI